MHVAPLCTAFARARAHVRINTIIFINYFITLLFYVTSLFALLLRQVLIHSEYHLLHVERLINALEGQKYALLHLRQREYCTTLKKIEL